jgi:hypothetical protein
MYPIDLQIPVELQQIAAQPRVTVRRQSALRKDTKCVVYWMQRAMRITDNPALDVAVDVANGERYVKPILFKAMGGVSLAG